MTNHPNRGKPSGASSPAPAEIKAARLALGLSQTAASAIVYTSLRNWQQWEAGECRMHPASWELFSLKTAVNL